MMKNILTILGVLLLGSSALAMGIKFFAPTEIVLRYYGTSGRSLDGTIVLLAVSLIFLGISSILERLDQLLKAGSPPK